MNTKEITQLVQVVVLLAVALGFLYYLSRVMKPSGDKRERLYILGTASAFLLLLLGFIPFVFAPLFGGFDSKARMPDSAIPFIFLMPIALVVGGLTQVIFANDAARLYKRRRAKGKISKWVVSELPKREFFILKGGMAAATGLFMLVVLIVALSKGW